MAQSKLENFEREFAIISKNFEGNAQVSGEFRRLFSALGDIRGSLVSKDIKDIYIGEPIQVLGDITGSDNNFLRLQSAFRALTAENELLRARYIQWKEGLPNVHAIEDKDKIITSLTRQIVDLTSQRSEERRVGKECRL